MFHQCQVSLLDVLHDDRVRRLDRTGVARRRLDDGVDRSARAAARIIGLRRHRAV